MNSPMQDRIRAGKLTALLVSGRSLVVKKAAGAWLVTSVFLRGFQI
jgi:hypothetical protein